ncbi:hypothetical protein LVQ71_05865 [Klebsiella pneumoniae]|uniref:hypothetical protein n=1 Tax=Klebsiella pneumoniae TaxID=573 RepID=UPI00240D1391|nr:hypothetical protein [Klebsiella pneumoniae]WFA36531.1 hypothetical protein LVQ71_05865 [Klebsiella pneumoniae]HCD6739191.1 hypothetical protein [Klebsiella pneumoniae]
MTANNDKIDHSELLKIKVDIWKHVISTQQHFNDLAMKIRNFAILILSAFIGVIGVSFKSGFAIPLFGHYLSASFFLALGAACIWMLFFFVDVYWYHPLLVGSVNKGAEIEKNIGSELKDFINLTQVVGKESPKEIKLSFRKKVYWKKEYHSKDKAKLFYMGVFWVLITFSIAIFFMDGPVTSKESNKNLLPTKLECQKTISLNKINCTITS